MESTQQITASYTLPGTATTVHVLGIRHHGPGSAQRVMAYLEAVRPDLLLVEGPPEGDALLPWIARAGMKPPVALLCYQPDEPGRSVFYPFAEFSPEWQAIRYGLEAKIHVRFFDLPAGQQMALEKEREQERAQTAPENAGEMPSQVEEEGEAAPTPVLRRDPISYLAEAAGYEDGEAWWDQTFEHRSRHEEVFDAVAEAMQHLRTTLQLPESRVEQLREAHMRRAIRQGAKELFQNIVVVCGAWHVPALLELPPQKYDNDLLKGLPKVKTECTWVPWTHDRLSFYSGYGAGILSPGWYQHIWTHPSDDGTRWLSRVAGLLRENGMDTSTAHVIEAVRLAGSLASLRGRWRVGLDEMNEAALSVLCHGETQRLALIREKLTVGNVLGGVPDDIPRPPLQLDIERQQRSLRLPPTADFKDYTLDLRKDLDLQRSIFLHRLGVLGIRWAEKGEVSGKGTFKEQWRLQWDPAFSIDMIEKGTWGNTVEAAAGNFVIHQAGGTTSLANVTALLQAALPAELHAAIDTLIQRINNLAAASADVLQLAEAIPPLASVSRYGNVRRTDAARVLGILESMVARVCVGLPPATTGIDEEAALQLLEVLRRVNESIGLLQRAELQEQWLELLRGLAHSGQTAPAVAGYAARLLRDAAALEEAVLVSLFAFRMSPANAPGVSAAWLEGFLKGSGTLLLLDEALWTVLYDWVDALDDTVFLLLLPLLRRTFAQFTPPERRKLGEKAKNGNTGLAARSLAEAGFDSERAATGLPVVWQLLGLSAPPSNTEA